MQVPIFWAPKPQKCRALAFSFCLIPTFRTSDLHTEQHGTTSLLMRSYEFFSFESLGLKHRYIHCKALVIWGWTGQVFHSFLEPPPWRLPFCQTWYIEARSFAQSLTKPEAGVANYCTCRRCCHCTLRLWDCLVVGRCWKDYAWIVWVRSDTTLPDQSQLYKNSLSMSEWMVDCSRWQEGWS